MFSIKLWYIVHWKYGRTWPNKKKKEWCYRYQPSRIFESDVYRHQNLTSTDVRFWRLKSLKGLKPGWHNGRLTLYIGLYGRKLPSRPIYVQYQTKHASTNLKPIRRPLSEWSDRCAFWLKKSIIFNNIFSSRSGDRLRVFYHGSNTEKLCSLEKYCMISNLVCFSKKYWITFFNFFMHHTYCIFSNLCSTRTNSLCRMNEWTSMSPFLDKFEIWL